jgi:hypothetical protein
MTEESDEWHKSLLFEILHTLVTFAIIVTVSAFLEHVFADAKDGNAAKSGLQRGLESFAPSEVLRFYFNALGWQESALPGLNYLLDVHTSPEYRVCQEKLASVTPSPLGKIGADHGDQGHDRRVVGKYPRAPIGDEFRENQNRRIMPPQLQIPKEHEYCRDRALEERQKYFWFSSTTSVFGLRTFGALADLAVYEFHAQGGWALFAVYAQVLLGVMLTAVAYWYIDVPLNRFNGILFVPAAILAGSMIAGVLQFFALGVVFGAWFTAPYKAIEFGLHKGVDKYGSGIIRRLHV